VRTAEMVRRPDRSERQGSDEPWHTWMEKRRLTRGSIRDGFLGRPICLKKFINPRSHLPSFGNRPDDERGAALGVAAGKDAVEIGHEVFVH
jgi:hypothetical protein